MSESRASVDSQGSQTEPLFCESRFGGLNISNRRLEAIRATRLKCYKHCFLFCIDSREYRPDSRCGSPGHLSFLLIQGLSLQKKAFSCPFKHSLGNHGRMFPLPPPPRHKTNTCRRLLLGNTFCANACGASTFVCTRSNTGNIFDELCSAICQVLGEVILVRIHAALVFAPARIQERIPGALLMYGFRARGPSLQYKDQVSTGGPLLWLLYCVFSPRLEPSGCDSACELIELQGQKWSGGWCRGLLWA